ncbi:MAG: hypothetical protein ACJ74T_03075, partial [Pyrinomonadaceae bacterium]
MRKRFALPLCLLLITAAALGCSASRGDVRAARVGTASAATQQTARLPDPRPRPSSGSPFLDRLAEAAVER